MEEIKDVVRERAKERLASMDRETLGEKSIEEVKNIYNQFVAEEQAKENNIREMAQEKLAEIDRDVLGEMSIEAVKDKYNELKEEQEELSNHKECDLNKMFAHDEEDSVKTK